jgi:integrase
VDKSSGRRRSLNKTAIDALTFRPDGPIQQIVWDPGLAGFGVRLYASGRKSFVVGYRVNGRFRLMVLAPYGTWTLDKARRRAKTILGDAASGEDHLAERQRARQADTLRELADRYIEYVEGRKKTWRTDRRRLDRWVLPHLGSRKIESVDLQDMQDLHDRIAAKAPYEANRIIEVVRRMFNLAVKWKVFPSTVPNPCIGVEKTREVSRSEYVPPERLGDLAKAIDAEDNVYVRAAFWLFLLTGMRRSELLTCKWEQVDLDNRRIWLPQTKGGQPRYVPLSKAAIDIIKATPRMLGNPYLLPGHIRGRPLVNIDKPWRRIRDRTGLHRLRIHDLRRTAGSYMVQAGHSIHAVKDILGHKSTKTTEIYARLAEQRSQDTVEAHGKALLAAVEASKAKADAETA